MLKAKVGVFAYLHKKMKEACITFPSEADQLRVSQALTYTILWKIRAVRSREQMKLKKPLMVRESDSQSNQKPGCLQKNVICTVREISYLITQPFPLDGFYAFSTPRLNCSSSVCARVIASYENASDPCKKIQGSRNIRFSKNAIFPEISGIGHV
jgi:hypothetical protein